MMTLDNLLAIGRLQRIPPDREAILRLMTAAERNLAEISLDGMSAETRFDLAYKCILKVAMAGLAAKGFRTSQNQPGHHATAIQCLGWTLEVPSNRIIVFEKLRKQRNIIDYSGDLISEQVAQACVAEATSLTALALDALA
jgi:hypothetical protein